MIIPESNQFLKSLCIYTIVDSIHITIVADIKKHSKEFEYRDNNLKKKKKNYYITLHMGTYNICMYIGSYNIAKYISGRKGGREGWKVGAGVGFESEPNRWNNKTILIMMTIIVEVLQRSLMQAEDA